MGQFNDKTIKEVIENLNQSYFLPDIQREYVWLEKADEQKIEQLFDSILRGYPIGSFLFWKLKKDDIETNKDAEEDSKKLNFQLYKFIENYDIRKPHNEKIGIEQINCDDLSIVLDGQQRLTSLYIGLKGTRTLKKPYARRDNPNAYEEKQLYINLRYQPSEERPDDNYKFKFYTKTDIPAKDESNFWFKVGDILTLKRVNNYAMENQISGNAVDVLEDLKNAFCVDGLISYFEETDKDLDKVLKIFIRVNSGGTKLSYSDLLMSILTANFSSNIRDKMNDVVDELEKKGFAVMGRDQILKTCLLLTDSNHIFQLKNFSKSNINKIEKNWDKIIEAIYKATDLLKEFGYTDRLSSAYILSIVAYYIFKEKFVGTENDEKELLKFVQNAQIKGYFSTSTDSKLTSIIEVVKASATFEIANKELLSKPNLLKISNDDIDEMMDYKYGSPKILPILQILYPNLDYKNATFHIDHIYPKSKFNSKNSELDGNYLKRGNFLYNLQLLEGAENKAKNDKDPESWLDEYYSSSEQRETYKERNYIDKDFTLDWNKIGEFEKTRTEKIKNKLKEILLKSNLSI